MREEASGREARDGRHFERPGRHLARANEARGRISHDVRENQSAKIRFGARSKGLRGENERDQGVENQFEHADARTRTRATPSPGSGNVRERSESLNAFLDERESESARFERRVGEPIKRPSLAPTRRQRSERLRVYSENPTATKTIGTKERRGDEIGERVGR